MQMPNISWVTDKQVPTVDAADLKALHKIQTDLAASHNSLPPGQTRIVGYGAVQKFLTPGADIGLVIYRLGWLGQLQAWSEARPEEFPWIKGDKIDDAVFKALAVLPMTGIPNEGITGLPFDTNELVRLIESAGGEVQ
jgi:hypothetical protein